MCFGRVTCSIPTDSQARFAENAGLLLEGGEEHLRVEVTDPLEDEKIARGKQFWKETSQFIWYTPSTGIWQSVWLEPVVRT